jgi:hypothetical protein
MERRKNGRGGANLAAEKAERERRDATPATQKFSQPIYHIPFPPVVGSATDSAVMSAVYCPGLMPTMLVPNDEILMRFGDSPSCDVTLRECTFGDAADEDSFANISFRPNADFRFLSMSTMANAPVSILPGCVETSYPAPTIECLVETAIGEDVALYDTGSCYTAVSMQFVCRYNQLRPDCPLVMTPAAGVYQSIWMWKI